MPKEWEWERLSEPLNATYTHRMKVPGGWIIRTMSCLRSGISIHQVFVKEN